MISKKKEFEWVGSVFVFQYFLSLYPKNISLNHRFQGHSYPCYICWVPRQHLHKKIMTGTEVLDTDGHRHIFSYVGYVKLDEDQLYIKHRYKYRFID